MGGAGSYPLKNYTQHTKMTKHIEYILNMYFLDKGFYEYLFIIPVRTMTHISAGRYAARYLHKFANILFMET